MDEKEGSRENNEVLISTRTKKPLKSPSPNSRPNFKNDKNIGLTKQYHMEPQTRNWADEGEGRGSNKISKLPHLSNSVAATEPQTATAAIAENPSASDMPAIAAAHAASRSAPTSTRGSRSSDTHVGTPRKSLPGITRLSRDKAAERDSPFTKTSMDVASELYKKDLLTAHRTIGQRSGHKGKNQVPISGSETLMRGREKDRTSASYQLYEKPLDWEGSSFDHSMSEERDRAAREENISDNETRILPRTGRELTDGTGELLHQLDALDMTVFAADISSEVNSFISQSPAQVSRIAERRRRTRNLEGKADEKAPRASHSEGIGQLKDKQPQVRQVSNLDQRFKEQFRKLKQLAKCNRKGRISSNHRTFLEWGFAGPCWARLSRKTTSKR